jgi:hypothetical protein
MCYFSNSKLFRSNALKIQWYYSDTNGLLIYKQGVYTFNNIKEDQIVPMILILTPRKAQLPK